MKIGILGLAGAGKDTTALLLQQALKETGYDFKIDRFAAPLKQAAKRIFGSTFDDRDVKEVPVSVDPDHMLEVVYWMCDKLGFHDDEMGSASECFDEHLGLTTRISPRVFQQVLGTEIVRAVRPTAWVDRINNLEGNVIVPDVRFENEVLDINILVTRELRGTRPEHTSEHLAWCLAAGWQHHYPSTPKLHDLMHVRNTGSIDELVVRIAHTVATLDLSGAK